MESVNANKATVRVAHASEVETSRICYQFGEEPMYPFNVVLNMVSATGVEPKTVVKGQSTSVQVTLSTPVEGATAKLVAAGETCESENVFTVNGAMSFAAGVTVTGAIATVGEASDYVVCLRLAEGEYHQYPALSVHVVEFQLERKEFVVADFSISLTVAAASGLSMQDTCFFTAGATCDGSNEVTIDGETFTPMSGFVTVVFTAPGKNVNLCCSLSGMEPTLLQSNVIGEVAQLMDVAGLNLHYAMLPYNVEKQMRLYGSGLITGAFWLTKEDTECDDVENRLPLAGEQNVITFAEHQSTDFSMRPLAQDSIYTLCYSYRNDPALSYKKYVFYPISVTSIVAREKGKDDLAVVGAEKSFNIFGSHLSTADYLGWSRN